MPLNIIDKIRIGKDVGKIIKNKHEIDKIKNGILKKNVLNFTSPIYMRKEIKTNGKEVNKEIKEI
ncbi:hypothetical protein [Caldiplasma sukawensis]